MASVTLDRVTKHFGDVVAVDDVSIEVQDREFLVLVGPSGCGKSTTLRMVAGLEELTGGDIHIGDRLVNDVPPKDRDIAMVFQSYALYPHMSVYDNLAFGLKLRKTPKTEIQRRVAEAADMLNISELLERKPRALSGGQRQRVAVGRAIVRDPAVFLMDEPLSNLDAKLRVQTRARADSPARALAGDRDLRDARPDGSHDDGVADRGAARRRLAAARAAAGGLCLAEQRVRRRIHRQPGDEFLRRAHLGRGRPMARDGDAARRRAAGPARVGGAARGQRRHIRHSPRKHLRPTVLGRRCAE